jgi:hypothetical protein
MLLTASSEVSIIRFPTSTSTGSSGLGEIKIRYLETRRLADGSTACFAGERGDLAGEALGLLVVEVGQIEHRSLGTPQLALEEAVHSATHSSASRSEYSVPGDTMNRASRLMAAAEVAEILMSGRRFLGRLYTAAKSKAAEVTRRLF